MDAHSSLAALIEKWCLEAVAIWGMDWPHISDHIGSRYAELDEAEQARLEGEVSITLAGSRSVSDGVEH